MSESLDKTCFPGSADSAAPATSWIYILANSGIRGPEDYKSYRKKSDKPVPPPAPESLGARLRVDVAAKAVGHSASYVYRFIKEGRITAVKEYGATYVLASEIQHQAERIATERQARARLAQVNKRKGFNAADEALIAGWEGTPAVRAGYRIRTRSEGCVG